MRLTEALAGALEGTDVRAFDVAPGVVETEMTRAMPLWKGFTDWTPPERVVELVAAIAAGELDQWSGRYLRPARTTSMFWRDDPGRRRPRGCASGPTGTATRSPDHRRRSGQRLRPSRTPDQAERMAGRVGVHIAVQMCRSAPRHLGPAAAGSSTMTSRCICWGTPGSARSAAGARPPAGTPAGGPVVGRDDGEVAAVVGDRLVQQPG